MLQPYVESPLTGPVSDSSIPETWLKESMVEAAFRCIADERELTMKSHFIQLDIKVGEWEPLRRVAPITPETELSIYSCWRDPTFATPSKTHVLALPRDWRLDDIPVDDSTFEQRMFSAGLRGPLGVGFCPTW